MPTYNTTSACTVQRRDGSFCDAQTAADMPFPICARHAMKLYRHVHDQVDAAKADPASQAALLLAHMGHMQEQDDRRNNSAVHQVYYVRVGDLIKIGTTANVPRRMHAYPPDAELLAIEPGGKAVEYRRLRQFEHLLAHRQEWFRPGADLLDHIEAVRRKHRIVPAQREQIRS